MILGQRDKINARSDSMVYSTSATQALALAAVVHKFLGREDISREAVDLGRQFKTHSAEIDDLIYFNEQRLRQRSTLTLSTALDTAATLFGEQVSEGLHRFARLQARERGDMPQVVPFHRFGTQLTLRQYLRRLSQTLL
jgi:hypothetical protein